MQLRTTSTVTFLALLSSAAYSSQPLAFTTTTSNSNVFSTRVRKRVLARTFLHAANSDQSSSEFTAQHPRLSRTQTSSTNTNSGISTPTASAGTSSTLSMIVDSEKEFEINLGRAVDTLKSDYPNLLTEDPSWNLYHDDLEVIDPTGVSLHGLENYKMAFSFIHGFVNWFYCEEKSGLTGIRVGYDWARKVIRVSWNVEVVPKMIYGGIRKTLHVDGISEYYLDRESGLITEHKVSHLLINNQPVRPVNGIFNAIAEMSPDAEGTGVPVFFKADKQEASKWEDMTRLNFQTWNPFNRPSSTSLFSNPNEQAMTLPESNNNPLRYDSDAFQRKNESRKKFGVKPLTPEEFIAIEAEIRDMDAINKKKAAYITDKIGAQSKPNTKKEDSFLSNIFGGVLKNGCENNFDCERPQVCCDVGFKKICCSNGLGIVDGMPVENYQRRGPIKVPMPNDDYDRY
mmetsp:Transcript_9690/g.21857  ORF Transcript_9690/g.21857 Transcript_9690/m.21857 type:complete len:456 (+) Transcript_9690:163-1530(+)|eukprot:CAMPEP_0172321974 /NCGR_PEP_ID=MMETSP1058-20130122/44731_1 /TAXON_ID=83371 /ORGANISM="Detonula confervacea, Strain CCMP 353" /LENGTH=455 /DNA_ID=CAMNT_0013037601 /DNA_START=114 /DNA_END=1481 /DNA_ORIENTATION=-